MIGWFVFEHWRFEVRARIREISTKKAPFSKTALSGTFCSLCTEFFRWFPGLGEARNGCLCSFSCCCVKLFGSSSSLCCSQRQRVNSRPQQRPSLRRCYAAQSPPVYVSGVVSHRPRACSDQSSGRDGDHRRWGSCGQNRPSPSCLHSSTASLPVQWFRSSKDNC